MTEWYNQLAYSNGYSHMATLTSRDKSGFPWQAELLRFTAFFPHNSPAVASPDWWEKIVGVPPEQKQERPREGSSVQSANLENAMVTLVTTPTRIDFVYSALVAPEGQLENPEFRVVGDFYAEVEKFDEYAAKIINLAAPINRLAFGSILLNPVADRKTGYMQLVDCLPTVSVDAENSRDFFYQINRPINSTVDGTPFNRLSKWSVAVIQPFTIEISGAGEGARMSQFVDAGKSALRLELDLSTSAERVEAIDPANQMAAWDELVNNGIEIARRGDFIND